jgi:hypothetical protein
VEEMARGFIRGKLAQIIHLDTLSKTIRNFNHDNNGAKIQTRDFQDTKLRVDSYTATSDISFKTVLLSSLAKIKNDNPQALYKLRQHSRYCN